MQNVHNNMQAYTNLYAEYSKKMQNNMQGPYSAYSAYCILCILQYVEYEEYVKLIRKTRDKSVKTNILNMQNNMQNNSARYILLKFCILFICCILLHAK